MKKITLSFVVALVFGAFSPTAEAISVPVDQYLSGQLNAGSTGQFIMMEELSEASREYLRQRAIALALWKLLEELDAKRGQTTRVHRAIYILPQNNSARKDREISL